MKNKMWLLVSVIAIFAMAFTACQSAAEVEEAAPVEEAAVEEPAVEEEAAPIEEAAVIDCTGVTAGDTLTVMYTWSGSEEEKANTIFKPFVDACGVEIVAESTRDEAIVDTKVKSTPPDILFWSDIAPLTLYADSLVDLTTVGAAVENYADYWVTLGSVDGALKTLPVKSDPKSFIWYSPAQFETYGYSVPTTMEELDTLVEQMVTDGLVPWSMGFYSEGAVGWSGSDFIQDTLLAQQGPDYIYDIMDGTVPYDDAGVVAAYETYAKWASDEKYTVGGATGTVSTAFLDAIYKVFQPEPEAMMVKQSGFAGGEVATKYPDLVYGTDYDFFMFPGVKGVQGGADYMFVFNDTPAVKAMVAYLTGAAGAEAWAAAGFDVCPNKLSEGKYTDVALTKKADILLNSTGFTPDLGDTIPSPFGTAEWAAIVEVVQDADIPTALATVAAAQAEALGQ